MAGEIYYPSELAGLHGMERNAQFAEPGPFQTMLNPIAQTYLDNWVRKFNIPITPDYDMRGLFHALMMGKGDMMGINPFTHTLHFSDIYKTPLHESFSRESKYAKPNAPYWRGPRLLDEQGKLIHEDEPGR